MLGQECGSSRGDRERGLINMFRVQGKLGQVSLVAVLFLLAVGGASAHSSAQHRTGDAAAARNAMSSTHVLSRAPGHALRVTPQQSVARYLLGSTLSFFHGSAFAAAPLAATGCGASGTIADKSGFEDADGNLAVDKAGCMDWNGFAPVTWTGSAPYQNSTKISGNYTFFGVSDAFDSSTDSSYDGGVKQADECPGTGTGSVDNKTDIARIYVAASTDPVTKHVFLDLAWIRAPQNTTTSDVHIGFEFNQNKTPCAAGSAFVHRTAGDILLVYNFQSGSASIAYAQWTGSAWTSEVTLASNIAEAKVFGGTSTTDSIKPSNGLNPATDEFGEAGIDLTAATSGLGTNGRACEQFGTAFGESRTSGSSTSAQMKDYVGPANIAISNCVTPSLTTTQQPAAGAMGDTFKDKATLAGANTPDGTGKITFKLYSAADCGGSVLDTETVSNINANGDYTTPNGFQLNSAGTYYWVASFSGDGYNNAQTTGCNDEPVTVAKASPSIVTAQQPASGAIGITYKDKATLSNAVNLKGTGTINFKLYSAADCGGSVLDDENVSSISANGDYSTPVGFAIQNAGTYYWVASFNGDANNKSFTSGCNDEPVVVAKNQPSIVTTQLPASGAIGDLYKDKATLSAGVNYDSAGAINFKLYSAADCGGSVLDSENVTAIAANGDYTTPTGFHIQNAGTYYWVASFNGDANNKSFTSGCNDEPVVVAKNQPSIVTTQLPASGAIGDLYKDKATLSGGVNYASTGAVNFKLYSAADCGGSVLDNENVTAIAANGDYTTPTGFHIQNAGTYYWVASFNGDANNKSFTSGCNDEPVVVGKNQPSILTTQQPASGAIGATYKDKATLSAGVNYDGTGAINFKLYSAADCGGSVLDNENVSSISANGDYSTPVGFAIQNAGTYYWVASFNGDANNKSFTSGCNDEPVVVGKNQPSIVTTQQPAAGAIGATYKDKATLSGGANYAGTGAINFKLYSAADCGGSVLDNEDVTAIAANGDYTTPNGFAIQNAGTYYWVASFNGDANNKSFTSACNDEPVVVAKNQPSIVTTQLPASGAIGDLYKDKATLSAGVNYDSTGAINFKLYSAADCGGSVLDNENVTAIAANGDYTTPTGFHIQNAGTYYWVASFNGDANNKSFTSACNDEPVVVAKNQPSIVTTQQPASGAIGDTYNDKATLSGGVNYAGTGSITFKLYSAAACGGSVLDNETVSSIAANGDYTTPDGFAIQNAGTYYWVASFSGDANNKSFTSACNDEPVVVAKNQPSILTTQQPASGSIGATYKDKATLSNAANLKGTGTINFKLYSAADCGGSVLDNENVTGISANGDYATPNGFQLNNAGTYYWVASFNGDANNKSFTSACNDEPVVVGKNQPSIVTTQQPASGSVADTYKDKATLSGGVNFAGTGSINFKLYSAADCGGSVLDNETVSSISANGDYTTPSGVQLNSAGTYYWVASFSGDANNAPYTSACNDEPVVVNPASIHIVKTADAAQVNAGDQIGFTLTVYNTGTGNAYGVTLSDPLPTNLGLSWTIEHHGAGWGNSCAITLGTLNCGPVTVPAGTTKAASTFTVHITSTTTAATGGVCPDGSGVVNNTGSVSTTNDGSDEASASTCVAAPVIKILKTADAAQVSAGDQIGFTVTVYNTGSGDAYGVNFTDPLPTNTGLSWTIEHQGAGWSNSCAITLGTLHCGPATVLAGTTKAASTFTVHITSGTTAATGGSCPDSGVVNNTGSVSTTNDGSDQSSASVCVAAPDIQILKTADAALVNAGDQIGFTLTVYNSGTGDAKGVTLSDPLPTNLGLSWTIEDQGAGWGGSCAIALGTLHCGPVTVSAGTTKAASTFTVHIISGTTAATGGVCPDGSGVVDNTGSVATTNDGSGKSSASTCVASPSIHIVKAADAAQVNAGDQIGFTMTVYNNGTGDASGVSLSDPLPTNDGLSWTIESQGAGWNNTCSIDTGTLDCGPVTVPHGTTKAASTFTVHIISGTTAATGGDCPETGVVHNTGSVTTSNDGSDQSSASTCVAAPAIKIVKTADAAQVNAGDQIGFKLTVYNTGSGDAYGVNLTDPLPTNDGLSWTIESQGAGWNNTCAITLGTLHCGPVTVPHGTTKAASTFTVHIVSGTTAATGGVCPDGSGVVNNTGSVSTTNDGSDESLASTCVAGPEIHIVKTADAAQVNAGDQIGFTMTVYNAGSGDAYGVNLSDPLPTNDGLSWTIEDQGSGWNSTCSITTGTLNCGPVTVPAGTTKAGSTFTVHVVSGTTAATGGVCPDGSGVVDNTGSVSTLNDGSDEASASTCVAAPSIKIAKTADATQVNAGDQIGFTLTVYNTGSGDAYDVSLSDPLPKNDGLSWTIEHAGAGWASSCSITTGTLNCGPVTVPAGTTKAGSTFTVHVVSGTTAATGGVCPDGSGVVDNTGSVTTSNDGSDEASASTCVAAPSIQIDKTADADQVNQGEQIGFTVTVYNTGSGDAYDVNLSDPLPANDGLSWTIEHQGDGWNSTCSIDTGTGTLNCGPVTVPAGTSEEASTFTVHIVSSTGPGSGGLCPETGVVDNTASVSTSNDGSGEASASTCVEGVTDLQITKTGAPGTQDVPFNGTYQDITWTMVVTNNGPDVDTNVQVGDPIPAGTTYVSSSIDPTKGSCTLDVPTSTLNCSLGTMLVGASVTITLVTTPLPADNGQLTNTAVVTGALPETTTENNTATAHVLVTREGRPPTFCSAVIVRPRQLYAGRTTQMHLTVINHHHVVQGVRVRITGPGIRVTTKPSNAAGKITKQLKPKKAGIVVFRPIATKSCGTPRIGVTGVFTPPVTG
jgi:uncharacterized repeat protein (TIGR01451 family)